MDYRYRPSILTDLIEHGIRPTQTTPPEVIREFLNSLYVFEIRELRHQRKEVEAIFGPQPLDAYSQRVLDLKNRYSALGVPLERWLDLESRPDQTQSGFEAPRFPLE